MTATVRDGRRLAIIAVLLGLPVLAGCSGTPSQSTVAALPESAGTTDGVGLVAGAGGRAGAAGSTGASEPAPLVVTLAGDVPATPTVPAGQPLVVHVRWSDGDGAVAGTTSDWGDAGTGSIKVGHCATVGPLPGAGVLAFEHQWAEPGTYSVRLTVTTSGCSTPAGAVEERTLTLPVTVTPSS